MEGKKIMYLSELFLQSLNGSYDTNTALIALEICNKELCGRMNGVEEEAECIRYFFCTDENGEIIEPNARYQELMDFWDVYRGFDDEIPYESKKSMWILQMIYEADSQRIYWEKERRKRELSQEQLDGLNLVCGEFEEKIGKKELVILLQEGTKLRVWERMELKGFDGEGPVTERDFAENELMKLIQSGGVAVLIVGRKGLTPQRFYGYSFSNCGCKKLDQGEADRLRDDVLKKECPMAVFRGKFKGKVGICVEDS